MIQYRKELRETIPDGDLALLDANMSKTLAQSCSDMDIPSSALVVRQTTRTMLWYEMCRLVGLYEDEWTGDDRRMPLYDFEVRATPEEMDEFLLGLAAFDDWSEGRAHCSTLSPEQPMLPFECAETDDDIDMF